MNAQYEPWLTQFPFFPKKYICPNQQWAKFGITCFRANFIPFCLPLLPVINIEIHLQICKDPPWLPDIEIGLSSIVDLISWSKLESVKTTMIHENDMGMGLWTVKRGHGREKGSSFRVQYTD